MSSKFLVHILTVTMALMVSPVLSQAAGMPDQVSLDTMTLYFEAVEFDHTMHTELGEDCSTCHHHTTGTGTTDERCISCHADSSGATAVDCRSCHVVDPFSADAINRDALNLYQFHIDTPGLKAAYHWNCIGCHERMDGPIECQQCHPRTVEGEAFYHVDASGSH